MATEKRLISIDEALEATHKEVFWTESEKAAIRSFLVKLHRADAVPVDEIKFLYCAIDEMGIPELKIKLGEKIICLRRENDPVDFVSVVRCKDCKYYDNSEGIFWCMLNSKFYPGGFDWHSFPEDGYCSYGERKDND